MNLAELTEAFVEAGEHGNDSPPDRRVIGQLALTIRRTALVDAAQICETLAESHEKASRALSVWPPSPGAAAGKEHHSSLALELRHVAEKIRYLQETAERCPTIVPPQQPDRR